MNSIGSTLNNRYRLEKEIGAGGFAHVFLATDLELGRQVAVKVLDQNWIRDKDLITRFRNEAKAVAALNHPNILPIYDFGVVKGAPYLVMPYMSGGTFSAHMKQNRLTLDEIGFYLDQIGVALDYAHQHGIVHRDVKPTNLLMRPNGELVLMDFGLAKLLQNVALEEQTAVVGTVAYMAPEQFHGFVSAASDIYVLGVLLYQMLTQKLPYEGNTTEILVGHVHLTPSPLVGHPNLQAIHPDVLSALDQVLAKVLNKLPANRYPSCKALSVAYYSALNADPRRAGRSSNREKNGNRPDFSGTLVTDKQAIMPPALTSAVPATEAALPSVSAPTPAPKPATGPNLNREVTPVISNTPELQPAPPLVPSPGIFSSPASPTPPAGSFEITEIVLDLPPLSSLPHLPASVDLDATQLGPKPKPPERKKVLLKPPRLLVTTEPDKGFKATFDLTGDTLTLGRAVDNTIRLSFSIISRYHAVFQRLNGNSQEPSYKIVQRQSINPIRFKGKAVQEKVLEPGDTVEIGERGHAEYIVKLTYQGPEFDVA